MADSNLELEIRWSAWLLSRNKRGMRGVLWIVVCLYPIFGVLDYLVAHELGHQWFYGVVGNDQAADPFLDEAVTDFLARSFLHQLRASQCAQARLDRSIYQYLGNCYYETIYIQGSQFLNQLRQDMGTALFWRTMRRFWADNRFTVSRTFKLLEAFRAAAGNWVLPRYRARFPSLYPS